MVRQACPACASLTAFGTAAALLYGGLAVMVGAWAWHGEWFDAYDALLWLIAFLVIEMDVLRMPATATSALRWKYLNSPHRKHQAANCCSNAAMKRPSSDSGSKLMPAATLRPPPVSNFKHSSSAPAGRAAGARTLTV